MEKLYSIQETADIFGVSKQTVHNWKTDGKLEVTATPGGELRVKESVIKAIIECGERAVKRKNNFKKEVK